MKKSLLTIIMAATALASCVKESEPTPSEKKLNCEIEGRWILKMYPNTMKQLTKDTIWTSYSTTGRFPGIDSAFDPRPYIFKNDILSISKSRNVYDTFKIEFKCDCNTMNLTNKWGTQVWYKEFFDTASCK
jgi:hypothetical protein